MNKRKNKWLLGTIGIITAPALIVSSCSKGGGNPDKKDDENGTTGSQTLTSKMTSISNNAIIASYDKVGLAGATSSGQVISQNTGTPYPSQGIIDEISKHQSSLNTILGNTNKTFAITKKSNQTISTDVKAFAHSVASTLPSIATANNVTLPKFNETDIKVKNVSFNFNGAKIDGHLFEIEIEGEIRKNGVEVESEIEIEILTSSFDSINPFLFVNLEYETEIEYNGAKAINMMPQEVLDKLPNAHDTEYSSSVGGIIINSFVGDYAKKALTSGDANALTNAKEAVFRTDIVVEEIEGEIESGNIEISTETEYKNIKVTNGTETFNLEISEIEYEEEVEKGNDHDETKDKNKSIEYNYGGNVISLNMQHTDKSGKLSFIQEAQDKTRTTDSTLGLTYVYQANDDFADFTVVSSGSTNNVTNWVGTKLNGINIDDLDVGILKMVDQI